MQNTGLEVLSFTGIVVFMIVCARSNYRLKVGRVDRENTFMYKIYFDIIMSNNGQVDEKNKEELIKEITENLSKQMSKEELVALTKQGALALEEELAMTTSNPLGLLGFKNNDKNKLRRQMTSRL